MQVRPLSALPALLLLLPNSLAIAADIKPRQTGSAISTSSQYISDSDFQSALLTAHNFFRDEHNATALSWNDTSAQFAAKWAKPCAFQHSGGPTGENIAAGYPNASAAVDSWANERQNYDFSKAQFGENTGHFTQVVWKATTSLGCGRVDCEGSHNTPGWFVVCEYYPPGNVIGEFAENVQSQVKGKNTDTVEGGVGGAGTLRIPWKESFVALSCAAAVAAVLW